MYIVIIVITKPVWQMFFKFSKNSSQLKNSYISEDSWPLKVRTFNLTEDYIFQAKIYPEIYIVTKGSFLHNSIIGKKSLRAGSIIVSNPNNIHSVIQPDDVEIIRIRYLHEWLASDFSIILSSSDMFLLFFYHLWFDYPNKSSIYTFDTDTEYFKEILNDLKTIRRNFNSEERFGTFNRITFLKILFHLSNEFKKYNRGESLLNLKAEIKKGLKIIEIMINQAKPLKIKEMSHNLNISMDHYGRIFKKATGITLNDYAQNRRVNHAAYRLLVTHESITSISNNYGFTDTAHFTKSFSRIYGITPIKYRNKYTKL